MNIPTSSALLLRADRLAVGIADRLRQTPAGPASLPAAVREILDRLRSEILGVLSEPLGEREREQADALRALAEGALLMAAGDRPASLLILAELEPLAASRAASARALQLSEVDPLPLPARRDLVQLVLLIERARARIAVEGARWTAARTAAEAAS